MSDRKIPANWQIGNESFALSKELAPKGNDFGKSFGSAGSLKPQPQSNANGSPVNSATSPKPVPTGSNTPKR